MTLETRLAENRMCFACGKDNQDGLQLEFEYIDGEVRTSLAFPEKFQGYADVVHGGLVSTVLDEAMATLVNRMGFIAVTAELSVRFLKPLCVGQDVNITARLLERRGKLFSLEASARTPNGVETARATAKCFLLGKAPVCPPEKSP